MKLVVLAMISLGAFAAPLVYTESVDGDLFAPGFGELYPTVFTLGVGANTIRGNFGSGASGSDFDSFAFMIPVGMSFTSGSVQLIDAVGNIEFSQWVVRTGATPFEGTIIQNVLAPLSPGTEFFSGLPLGPGTYSVQHVLISSLGVGPNTSDYVFTLTVVGDQTGVPEPSTFGLVAVTLAGLFATARRNRAR
ncbi:MAG: PEP-CTERM sorting domain-containing protein [Acidobacteria bacterium]|nr:PEP-CTERM sorting domain-containing protein [Acidobacteriota bacterium]